MKDNGKKCRMCSSTDKIITYKKKYYCRLCFMWLTLIGKKL